MHDDPRFDSRRVVENRFSVQSVVFEKDVIDPIFQHAPVNNVHSH